mmetsp:Transcript_2359/g.5477  ORF Transcript_2359/g.5477 Transcript_2359/m.5477 type:complete len:223 (-) Transcript_2359:343-1011(-)
MLVCMGVPLSPLLQPMPKVGVLAAEGVHHLQPVGHLFVKRGLVFRDAVTREHPLEGQVHHLLKSYQLLRFARDGLLHHLVLQHCFTEPVGRFLRPSPDRWTDCGGQVGSRCNLTALTIISKDELLLTELASVAQVTDVADHETPAKPVHHEVTDSHRPLAEVVVCDSATEEDITVVSAIPRRPAQILHDEVVKLSHGRGAVAHLHHADVLIPEQLGHFRLVI